MPSSSRDTAGTTRSKTYNQRPKRPVVHQVDLDVPCGLWKGYDASAYESIHDRSPGMTATVDQSGRKHRSKNHPTVRTSDFSSANGARRASVPNHIAGRHRGITRWSSAEDIPRHDRDFTPDYKAGERRESSARQQESIPRRRSKTTTTTRRSCEIETTTRTKETFVHHNRAESQEKSTRLPRTSGARRRSSEPTKVFDGTSVPRRSAPTSRSQARTKTELDEYEANYQASLAAMSAALKAQAPVMVSTSSEKEKTLEPVMTVPHRSRKGRRDPQYRERPRSQQKPRTTTYHSRGRTVHSRRIQIADDSSYQPGCRCW
jgi:hypothetical protein